jgi:hypothetical protein
MNVAILHRNALQHRIALQNSNALQEHRNEHSLTQQAQPDTALTQPCTAESESHNLTPPPDERLCPHTTTKKKEEEKEEAPT